MKTTLLRLLAAPSCVLALGAYSHAATYAGNGNAGFGGVVGTGSIEITDNVAGNISATFTKGAADFNDAFVIYIDSIAGGFTTTGSFNDQDDYLRRSVSGASGGSTGGGGLAKGPQ